MDGLDLKGRHMNNPKEIAEKILKYEDKYETDTPVLARAYLELEKKIEISKPSPSSVHQKQYYVDIICELQSEITKLKAENEKLKLQNKQLTNLNL